MSDAEGTLRADTASQTTASPSTDAATPPSPRRARWLLRHSLTIGCLSLVTITLGVRLAWGWDAERRLAALRAEMRAAGERVDRADWDFAPLPDAQNAAILLDRAERLCDSSSPSQQYGVDYPDYFPLGPAWEAQAAKSEQRNAPALALVRQMRSLTRLQVMPIYPKDLSDLGTRWRGGQPGRVLNWPLGGCEIIPMLADAAKYSHATGNDLEAIERLRDLLHIVRLLRQSDFLDEHAIAATAAYRAGAATQHIAPGLKLTDPAVRQAADALKAELLQLDDGRLGFSRCVQFQRMIDSGRAMTQTPTWLLRPLVTEALIRVERHEFQVSQGYAKGAVGELNELSARILPREWQSGAKYRALKLAGLRDPMNLAAEINLERRESFNFWYVPPMLRSVSEARIAAVSIAAQAYKTDHSRWPESLKAMVPAYLPAVPSDPYVPGQVMDYRLLRGTLPGGGDRPVVSFGVQSPDGEVEPIPAEPLYADTNQSRLSDDERFDRDLSRWMPKEREYDRRKAEREAEEAERRKQEDTPDPSATPSTPDAPP
jgi:hypothetical protein